MKVFLCRWQNGDLSIVGARDREEAIFILDELADATDAEFFETKDLLINLALNDNGHLELHDREPFGEEFGDIVYDNAYPLLVQARRDSEDEEDDFAEAVKAERERLWPKEEIRPTEHLARNLLVTRIASDRQISLASALKRIKTKKLVPNEAWHTLAGTCIDMTRGQFATHMQLLHEHVASNLGLQEDLASGNGKERSNETSVRMACSPIEEAKLKPYDQNDVLPHFLLAAALAEQMRGSILMSWPYVSPVLQEEIGTFWHWLAQEVRALPI
jgi:hypothetical protein